MVIFGTVEMERNEIDRVKCNNFRKNWYLCVDIDMNVHSTLSRENFILVDNISCNQIKT